MRHHLIQLLLLAGLAGGTLAPDGESYHNDPVERYDRRILQGFRVFVSPRLLEHPEEVQSSCAELDRQLAKIAQTVPSKPLGELRKIPIWLERDETAGLGEFHWGPEPLVQMKRNPAKARAVEITNARHLVEWSPIQPWAVFHELAHAYHCVELGEAHPGLTRAYDQAVKSGKYDQVGSVQGGKKVAYARSSKAEYFAELSEAYFGKNDFEPFTSAELRDFDPVGYQLMVAVWGRPVAKPEPASADR